MPTSESPSPSRPWTVFVVPFVVYMLFNSLEPSRPQVVQRAEAGAEGKSEPEGGWLNLGIDYRYYPLLYTLKIAATTGLILWSWRDYGKLSWRISPLAIVLGAVGVVAWIGITDRRWEPKLLEPIGLGGLVAPGTRSAYNPLSELRDQPALAYGFLAIRFLGLAAIVPIIEEFFLRGFLMRYLTTPARAPEDQTPYPWWLLPYGAIGFSAIAATTGLAVLMHPAELFAELIWFSGITWLMLRTGRLADCVVAHATTNLLLGIYVVATGKWYFM